MKAARRVRAICSTDISPVGYFSRTSFSDCRPPKAAIEEIANTLAGSESGYGDALRSGATGKKPIGPTDKMSVLRCGRRRGNPVWWWRRGHPPIDNFPDRQHEQRRDDRRDQLPGPGQTIPRVYRSAPPTRSRDRSGHPCYGSKGRVVLC
jgi:hypothetical protein